MGAVPGFAAGLTAGLEATGFAGEVFGVAGEAGLGFGAKLACIMRALIYLN